MEASAYIVELLELVLCYAGSRFIILLSRGQNFRLLPIVCKDLIGSGSVDDDFGKGSFILSGRVIVIVALSVTVERRAF